MKKENLTNHSTPTNSDLLTREVLLLNKIKRINEPLLRVCYLLKIGLTGPQIVNLTGYPRQTVWVRIKRIEAVLSMKDAR